jgi:hypothetical protein
MRRDDLETTGVPIEQVDRRARAKRWRAAC